MSAADTADSSHDARRERLIAWLHSLPAQHALDAESIQPASADASFRRYFRVAAGAGSLIVMDAPPDKEDVRPFMHVARLLREAGLNAPDVIEADPAQGYLLLTDLGRETYLDALDDASAPALFADATEALLLWQRATRPGELPPYDDALLRRELALFPDWYVARHLGVTLAPAQREVLDHMFDRIVACNLAQPTVYVHRDYMPRNLMVAAPNPGILDFQDAVIGPVTYDLASLFRDAFVSWDEERVIDWAIRYWERARRARLPVGDDFATFWRDFEWMGLQRHLKVLGIFARINYRDGKPHYLADTPRFVKYVREVTRRYDELAPLARLFDELEGVATRVG
ncbi:MAG TPA: phosphotransferase [Burkholderiaceae bacterium]|nr:phosphotransferase [Burkholderiaceae bacterium]HQR71526.1 phosphotransferase [Burkholderiaceae bacterium]